MDPEFFEQLALPLFDSLYNLAHWLTGDQTDAEDLVQETYAKALKGSSRSRRARI
jgi:RNA polymerase sigma-70 factor, ECF subfamily